MRFRLPNIVTANHLVMKLKMLLSGLAIMIAATAIAAPPDKPGKTIFTSRCAGCHSVNKMVVGPALAGVDQRHDMDWIVRFVQSSQQLVRNGDKDAQALFSKYNVVMPDHGDLKADDIRNIVDFIKSEALLTANATKAPFDRPGKLRTS